MSKESLKARIYRYLTSNPVWIHGGEIEKLAMSAGYQGSTARRELNYLINEGKIINEIRPGKRVKSAWFKVKI